MAGYGQETVACVFAQARQCYEDIEGWLSGPAAVAMTHAELEDELGVRGRELLRRLYQGQLDLRAAGEQRRGDVIADRVPRTRTEPGHCRPLATVFGETTVTRIAYRAPGCRNAYPADAELNLPEEKHSHGLRKLTAIECPRGSFADAAATITRVTGAVIGKRQVEQMAVRAAADIDGFYAGRRPTVAGEDVLLVLTCDGKGIVMRPDALRPATAKAAAAAGN